MLKGFIAKLAEGSHLTEAEMSRAMDLILTGQVGRNQIAALLMGLRIRGETADEIVAAARVMRRRIRARQRLDVGPGLIVLDRDEINVDDETVAKTCRLNGGTQTFNISTATALVAAACGLKVAKCGARTQSRFCGSGDVVQALGVNLDLTLTEVERCVRQVGLGFLYAPVFHTPLTRVNEVREDLGIRTIFNLIGPLTNPARSEIQILGVYLPERTELMAQVLGRLEVRQAYVVCGQDTLDEMSVTGPTRVSRLEDGRISTFELNPEDLDLERAPVEAISGGDAARNAAIIREILDGATGPRRDVVCLNAAAALHAAGRVKDLKEGLGLAAGALESGRARAKLEELIDFTLNCGVYQRQDLTA